MDDRGTPINKGPIIGNKDVDLYKLFKVCVDLNTLKSIDSENTLLLISSKNSVTSTKNIIKIPVNRMKLLIYFDNFLNIYFC